MGFTGYTICTSRGALFPAAFHTKKTELVIRAIGGVILYNKYDDINQLVANLCRNRGPGGRGGRRKINGYKIYMPTKTEIDVINQFIVEKIMRA